MTELTQDLSLAQARSLIDSYAFDLGGDDAEQLLEYWLELYHPSWIRLATIEALYLGRYKAISIKHILSVWLRLRTPNPHFSYEFERLICRKLPKHLSDLSAMSPNSPKIVAPNISQTSTEAEAEAELKTLSKEQSTKQSSARESEELRDAREPTARLSQPRNPMQDRPLSDFVEDDNFNESLDSDKAFGNPEGYSESNQSLMSAIGFSCKSHWSTLIGTQHRDAELTSSEFTERSKIIHRFIPLPDVSSFFLKLKTFGESK
ncbi:MAG: hypothetical protein AAF383_14880 [Cyanobacteria bacterium P01_A01_bin.83]